MTTQPFFANDPLAWARDLENSLPVQDGVKAKVTPPMGRLVRFVVTAEQAGVSTSLKEGATVYARRLHPEIGKGRKTHYDLHLPNGDLFAQVTVDNGWGRPWVLRDVNAKRVTSTGGLAEGALPYLAMRALEIRADAGAALPVQRELRQAEEAKAAREAATEALAAETRRKAVAEGLALVQGLRALSARLWEAGTISVEEYAILNRAAYQLPNGMPREVLDALAAEPSADKGEGDARRESGLAHWRQLNALLVAAGLPEAGLAEAHAYWQAGTTPAVALAHIQQASLARQIEDTIASAQG